jgi:integrase
MPRLIHLVPRYRKHKPSGQAVVTLNGKDHYLGPHNGHISKREYERLIGEWLTSGRQSHVTATDGMTIIDAIACYWRHVRQHYVKDGRPTSEQMGIRSALRFVKELYAATPVTEFGPLAIKAVRQQMVKADLARSTINQNVSRIRRMFKWLVAEQLIPVTVHQSLCVVDGLRKGRGDARETRPVKPVDDDVVDATLPRLPAVVADMVRLQRYTGCRPAEVCAIRPRDIDRSGDIWRYVPESHKTEHHDIDRVIFIGPRAQGILLRYLARDFEAYCFRPLESEDKRRSAQHKARVVPLSCGTKPGDRRKRNRRRAPGDHYTTNSYRRAIERACDLAFLPEGELARRHRETIKAWKARLTDAQRAELKKWQAAHRWTPHRLRHTAGTEIRQKFGVEAARVCLGHTKVSTTELYSERDFSLAAEVAMAVG